MALVNPGQARVRAAYQYQYVPHFCMLRCLQVVLPGARIANPRSILHSTSLRRHLRRHHNSTRREPPAVCSAAAKKKPPRMSCSRAFSLECSVPSDMTRSFNNALAMSRKQRDAWSCVFSFLPRHLNVSIEHLHLSSGFRASTAASVASVCSRLGTRHMYNQVMPSSIFLLFRHNLHSLHSDWKKGPQTARMS